MTYYLIPLTFCGPLSAGFGLPTLVWCEALPDNRQVGERGWVGSDTPSSSPFYGTKILCLGTLVRTPGLSMSEIRLLDGSFHSFIHNGTSVIVF